MKIIRYEFLIDIVKRYKSILCHYSHQKEQLAFKADLMVHLLYLEEMVL